MYPLVAAVLPLLAALVLGAVPTHAADPKCMQSLAAAANRERQQVGIYTAEMKNLDGNRLASKGAWVCSGAIARADQYYNRQVSDNDVCKPGTSYVDSQVVHLFRNATSVCRDQFDEVARSLSGDQQRIHRANVQRYLQRVP
jgi:hypothetical protein